jgi:hypothetical protein
MMISREVWHAQRAGRCDTKRVVLSLTEFNLANWSSSRVKVLMLEALHSILAGRIPRYGKFKLGRQNQKVSL